MSQDAYDDKIEVKEHAGMRVVQLRSDLRAAQASALQEHLKRLVSQSTGLVLDCRDLPAGSTDWIAPLLYETMLVGRQQTPRVEVSAVGRLDQTTGGNGAFLLPPRFETLEAAAAAVGMRHIAALPTQSSRGRVSEQVVDLDWSSSHTGFWQTLVGQTLLAVLVLGGTASLVAWSASLSFSQATPPRRMASPEQSERIVLRGCVQYLESKTATPDAGAILLLWPTGHSGPKFSIKKVESSDATWLTNQTGLRVIPVNSFGAYSVEAAQLPERSTLYHVLAMSGRATREEPVPEEDQQVLAGFFEDSKELLGNRQFVLRSIFVDTNVTKDLDFLLSGVESIASIAASAAAPAPETGANVNPPSLSEM